MEPLAVRPGGGCAARARGDRRRALVHPSPGAQLERAECLVPGLGIRSCAAPELIAAGPVSVSQGGATLTVSTFLSSGGQTIVRLRIAPSVVDIEGMAGQDFPFDPAFAAGTGQWTAVTVPLRDGADRAMIAFRAALVAVQGPWTLRMPAGQGRSRRNNGPGSRRAVRSRAPPAAYPRSIRHPARCMRIASRACSGCPSA